MTKPNLDRAMAMARSPKKWPCWPQLPLKRSVGAGLPELGRLLAPLQGGHEVAPEVWMGMVSEPLDFYDRLLYPDLRGIFEDGWEVD